ncbi:MAG: DNA polymerase [Thaumarchaeota archaeon 13_1_40CM_38_12]|nr:MAG: DNA polymerase [Thaumarchaeota archaeon 13_1_40CM_38_12]OLC33607.1 MAG: DNA polymerase [Thaumarchaeota archaeon 13_1_40CM_4_38_7]OLD30268.1 MAG: DNA polymerase [Thaumarchaeota archaeon 13_1_40CM_2_39_7]
MAESLAISDYLRLSHIKTNVRQDRRLATSDLRPVHAVDTETDQEGNILVIADSESNFEDKITPERLIKWLFSKRYQGSWNFFYNITFDAEVILKTLGDRLEIYKKTRRLRFKFGNYHIEYIPSKKLAIKKGHHSSIFFDIAQYYKESLIDAYQSNIEKLDSEYLEFKSKRSSFSRNFYSHNPIKIRNYCIQDCKCAKELAEHWIKLFHLAFDFYPQRWISSGYLAEKVILNNKLPIPEFDSIPYEIQEIAWNCYDGGRFEILKRGYIGTAFLYDINSAYPYAFSIIPDFTRGKWKKGKSIYQNARLGFFKIEADIPDTKYIPPFPFRSNRKLIFPSGKFQTYCTLAELQSCENPNYYNIVESWQFCTDEISYPYKEFVDRIYSKRQKLKQEGNPLELPLKVILNSIYGKTAQRVNARIGNLFSPIIASTITGFVRAMLYDFVVKNGLESNVVSFATDSIITTKELQIDSPDLGSFKMEKSANDVYVLQNGIYRFNGKWKKRGIGKLGEKTIEHLDTIVKDGNLYQVFKVLRTGRLRTSILSDSISEIGKFKTVERLVNLNADRKRMWFEQLKDINDGKMIDSTPISMNHFRKDEV